MTPTATIPTTITTVETFFAAWNTGDLDTLETVADASIFVSDITGLLYTRAVYCGHAGLTEAVRELESRWHRFEMRLADAQPSDDGNVRALLHATFEKHGMSFDAEIPVVCELHDGLVVAISDDDAAYAA